uniref:Uncharacterized protein n=1 Tax=Heterorhabditis bacteriophora TaxID=37862 RepID=A0A1I7WVJ3_HETBA
MAPRCHKAPEAVHHLSAERFRSVQNCPTRLPNARWGRAKRQMSRLIGALRRKLTNKLTLFGVFQTHRPSAPKLTAASLFWMAIVAEHSIGRVWQEEGERNGDACRLLNGTDPALQIPLRMTYTTRPSQDFSDQ